MKNHLLLAAALARLSLAQDFDFALLDAAPSPSATNPPLAAASETTVSVDSAAVQASISQAVAPTTASVTGAAASAASTQEPPVSADADVDVEKRGLFDWWKPKTSTTILTTTKPATSATSTTQQKTSTGTTTTSATSACPTTPEEGTYCGFINPEVSIILCL